MTPTTPTKSPVDTIREYLLDRKSALDASLKYVMPYNVQKLIEDEFLRVCELLTALSSLSTQPYGKLVEAATELLKLHDIKTHIAQCDATNCPPDEDKVVYYMEHKPGAWEALRKALSISTQPSQTEGLEADREELIEKAARFFTEDGVYHPADNYYIVQRGPIAGDCARIIAGYLMDIMPSLPRQKGEVVAWMTDDGKVISASGKLHMEEAEHPVGIHYDIPLYK